MKQQGPDPLDPVHSDQGVRCLLFVRPEESCMQLAKGPVLRGRQGS